MRTNLVETSVWLHLHTHAVPGCVAGGSDCNRVSQIPVALLCVCVCLQIPDPTRILQQRFTLAFTIGIPFSPADMCWICISSVASCSKFCSDDASVALPICCRLLRMPCPASPQKSQGLAEVESCRSDDVMGLHHVHCNTSILFDYYMNSPASPYVVSETAEIFPSVNGLAERLQRLPLWLEIALPPRDVGLRLLESASYTSVLQQPEDSWVYHSNQKKAFMMPLEEPDSIRF